MEEELDISNETYEKVRKIYQDFINDNDDADWTLDDYLDEEEEYEENYYKKDDEEDDGFDVSQEELDRFIKYLEEDDEEDDFELSEDELRIILARKSLEHRRRKKDKILSSLTREERVCFFMIEAERGNELAEKYGMKTYDIEEN